MIQSKQSLVWLFAVLACVTSCSEKRPIQRYSSDVTDTRLDSLQLLSDYNQKNILGRFPRYHAVLDTQICQYGLDLIWWTGEGATPTIQLPWAQAGSRNLQEIPDFALQFNIKKKRQTGSTPVIVVGLQDETGHTSSVHLNQSHILFPALDTTWQSASIPFIDFSRGLSSTDLTRIKAIELKLENFGEIYIDKIKIGPHKTNRKIKRKSKKTTSMPCPEGKFKLFEEQFDHVWGLGNYGSRRTIAIAEKRGRNRSKCLELEWDYLKNPVSSKKKNHDNSIGFTWNKWIPVDIPKRLEGSKIQFHMKNIGINPGPSGDIPIEIGIVDHLGQTSKLFLAGEYFDNLRFGHWQTCSIPLSKFNWKREGDDTQGLSSIAFVTLTTHSKGHVFLDDIHIYLKN